MRLSPSLHGGDRSLKTTELFAAEVQAVAVLEAERPINGQQLLVLSYR
jgi:hypothetical protein